MESKGTLIPFDDHFMAILQDPDEVQGYLDVSFEEYAEDKNLDSLLSFLNYVATAKGGILQLQGETQANVQGLHKLLRRTPTPDWEAVLEALGYMFSVLSAEASPYFNR